MKRIHQVAVLLQLLTSSFNCFAQHDSLVTERINVFGPIQFQNKVYNLSHTSYTADSATYSTYKQGYLAAGDAPDTFRNMIIIDVFTGTFNLEDIANAKVDELRELQKTNPVVNYQSFTNRKTGEFMLDFIITENSPDGQYIDMAERSIYRYVTVTAKSGQQCGVLFGVITRSYGENVDPFMAVLRSKARLDLMRNVGVFKIPEITIPK